MPEVDPLEQVKLPPQEKGKLEYHGNPTATNPFVEQVDRELKDIVFGIADVALYESPNHHDAGRLAKVERRAVRKLQQLIERRVTEARIDGASKMLEICEKSDGLILDGRQYLAELTKETTHGDK